MLAIYPRLTVSEHRERSRTPLVQDPKHAEGLLKPGAQFIPTGDPVAVLMLVVNKVGFPRRLDSCENKKA